MKTFGRLTCILALVVWILPVSAHAQITTFTDRAAWEAAVAAASATPQLFDFAGLTLGRVTQTDTAYGTFSIVVDRVSASSFNNPGIDIFPDASCSLGTGDCDVFTFNMLDPTSTLDGPKFNRLVLSQPVIAFGGDFIQLGFTAGGTPSPTGPVTMQFGPDSVIINPFLNGSGNGFFGFVANVPATTMTFTFAKSGTIQNDIFQVYNPALAHAPEPAPVYGTAARATRDDPFGTPTGFTTGDIGVMKSRWYTGNGYGSQAGQGTLASGGLSAGAWSDSFTGAGRGIAFRSYRNDTAGPLTFRVNAVLDGEFRQAPFRLPNGYTAMGAQVRVFDADAFRQRLAASGAPAGEFLIGGYDLQEALDIEELFDDLGRLFPVGTGLAAGTTFYTNGPFDVPIEANVRTNSFVVQPGDSFTVLFDVATYSVAQVFADGTTGHASVDFLHTLREAAQLFTDDSGNPVSGIETLGPAPTPDVPITTLTLTPPTATTQLDTDHMVTVTVADSNADPVANTIVQFVVTSGPNAGILGGGLTNAAGQASFTYPGTHGTGTDEIRAEIGTLSSNVVQTTWNPPGVLDHITIGPGSANITAGNSQPFTAEAFDRFDFSRGDVTAGTAFTIAPDGSCAAASCTATAAGPHTVTGTHQGKAATASLTVLAGPVDRIVVTPATATLPVGTGQALVVAAFDAFSNSLGDVTGATTFSIAPDGSCAAATCTAPTPGAHTITATYNGKTAHAVLTFTSTGGYAFSGFFAPIDNLPVVNTMKAGGSVPVKFSLGGNQGLDIFAPGYPVSQAIACDSSAPEDQVEQTVTTASSGLTYDAATGQYVYTWRTDKAWSGKCRLLTVKLEDGSLHTAAFKLK